MKPYDGYLKEGYDVQPIHYLLKPIAKEMLKRALHVNMQLNHIPRTIARTYANKRYFLEVGNVIYFESQNHNLEEITHAQIRLKNRNTVPVRRTHYRSLQSAFVRYLNRL